MGVHGKSVEFYVVNTKSCVYEKEEGMRRHMYVYVAKGNENGKTSRESVCLVGCKRA